MTFSNRTEMPCPPPMQAEPMANFPFRRFNSKTKLAKIREPDAANAKKRN